MHFNKPAAPAATSAAAVPALPTADPDPANTALTAALTLPGVIGSELAQPVALLQAVMENFKGERVISRDEIKALTDAIARAHRIALQSQQITRLASGRLRQSHERLDIGSLLLEIIGSRRRQFTEAGVQVRHSLHPVQVIVDPGLLMSLLEVAVDWAVDHGQRLNINLNIKNWPEHGVLVLKSRQHITAPGSDAAPAAVDTLNWHLLLQTAAAMGVIVERETAADHMLLRIEFPRTVKQLEGLTAIEVDAGDESSFFLTESKPLAGHRLLLVTQDQGIRGEIKDICNLLGLMLDTTPTTQQAVRLCELDAPHMVIIDERLRDDLFEELRRDLARTDIVFPVIEIATQSNTFEMANWMSDSISRISRDVIRAQLPALLVTELGKLA